MDKVADLSHTRQIAASVVKKVDVSSCPDAPKLDPRVRRTRKLLEDALRALIEERPYAEISVSDISDRATINRATFYAHFDDKAHLASTMVSEDLHAMLIAHLAPPVPFGRDSLAALAEGMFEFMGQTHGGCRKHADEFCSSVGSTLQDTLQKLLRTWLDHDAQAMRSFPGASKGSVATVLSWSIYGAAIRWSRLSRRPEAKDAAREIVSLLVREPL
jgi:AcrR family transcriptional regulator